VAGEQSTGTFIDIPDETQEIKERYRRTFARWGRSM
jgi:hypothetical protein